MAVVFTKSRQLGTEEPRLVFETDLIELARMVGRLLPEIKGGKVHQLVEGDRSWLVVCTLRGSLVGPPIQELEVDVFDRTWTDGVVRVMQEALARLAFHHRAELIGTRFEYFGRRDSEGRPTEVPFHFQFERHAQYMEFMLHHTQTYLDRARMRSDTLETELLAVKEELKVAQLEADHQRKIRIVARKANDLLRSKVDALKKQVKEMESKIEDLEEEGEDLRKENAAFLSDDDDYLEEDGMDMEVEDEDDLDFINDEEEDPEPLLPEEEEEDPEEPPFDEDTTIVVADD